MFGKLKEKLKGALSLFSRKAEEEAEVKEIEVEQEAPLPVKKEVLPLSKTGKKVEKKGKSGSPPKAKDKAISHKVKKKEEKEEKKSDEKKSVPPLERINLPEARSEKKEIVSPEVVVVSEKITEKTTEKKGFFGRLFSRAKEEVVEEKKVGVSSAKEEIDVPAGKIKEDVVVLPVLPQQEEERKGFFGKIKQTLTTKTISSDKFEELFWDLELVLLENNVSVEVIDRIKEDLQKELVGKPLPRDTMGKIEETLTRTLKDILVFQTVPLLAQIQQKKKKPFVIAFFGINGAGKTTSIAKMTYYLQKNKLSVVLAAGDTFRAAAIQQLEEHADRLHVKMIKHDYGSDAAAVAFDAVKYAEKNNLDVVLIDTAGRLHSNTNLMAELEKIIRVAKPDFKLFVGESITGNDCIEQARQFNQLVEMDGVILTKVDVDEKGGAPLSISYTIKKPILFLGVGQRYEDFEEFDPDLIVKRLGF